METDRLEYAPEPVRDRYWLHLLLFLLTVMSTVYAGAEMAGRVGAYTRWADLGLFRMNVEFVLDGLRYSLSLLLFLSVHEFGHYFAARHHRVGTSLPYFIPFPLNGIGTFGAVIRIRDQVPSLRKLFDIGAAGPLAGFVAALAVLIYALATLPPPTYLLDMPGHEALNAYIRAHGVFPPHYLTPPDAAEGMALVVGQTPLYWFLSQFFANVPPMYEMYHYPVLFAGWLGLFFTALNLLPVGQLDGGHLLYALVGPKRHALFARGFVLLLIISGAIGFASEMGEMTAGSPVMTFLAWPMLAAVLFAYLRRLSDDPRRIAVALVAIMAVAGLAQSIPGIADELGYSGWLVWCLLIVFLIRVDHPPVLYQEPLTPGRRRLAWLGLVIFVLCFSLKPLYIL